MPEVSEAFIKSAETLSQAIPELLAKIDNTEKTASAASDKVIARAEVAADVLVEHGLVPASEKSAAIAKLSNHEEALKVLTRTASEVTADSMGTPKEKKASNGGSDVRESDRALLSALGFGQ